LLLVDGACLAHARRRDLLLTRHDISDVIKEANED